MSSICCAPGSRCLLLPVEEIVRYNVENVRVLACVAERLKQPGVKGITAYGGWPTVASRIWLIGAAARSA